MARKETKSRKQYLVIGLGRFGGALAQTLCENGAEVLGMDKDMETVEAYRDMLTQVVCADATDEEAMKALGVKDFDAAFVTHASELKSSCVAVMMLREMGVEQVIAKAQDEFHGRMLTKLGAERVLFPERDQGRRVAANILSGRIREFIELSADFDMLEIAAEPSWAGRKLAELDLRNRLSVNVVAIRSGSQYNAMPQGDTVVREDDILLVVAAKQAMQKLQRYRG